jgi:hypothetical protein
MMYLPAEHGEPALAAMRAGSAAQMTNGYSKKLRNHKAAGALYVAHYNLCRVHETLRITPAMALVDCI